MKSRSEGYTANRIRELAQADGLDPDSLTSDQDAYYLLKVFDELLEDTNVIQPERTPDQPQG